MHSSEFIACGSWTKSNRIYAKMIIQCNPSMSISIWIFIRIHFNININPKGMQSQVMFCNPVDRLTFCPHFMWCVSMWFQVGDEEIGKGRDEGREKKREREQFSHCNLCAHIFRQCRKFMDSSVGKYRTTLLVHTHSANIYNLLNNWSAF